MIRAVPYCGGVAHCCYSRYGILQIFGCMSMYAETYPDLGHLHSFSETLPTTSRSDWAPVMASRARMAQSALQNTSLCTVFISQNLGPSRKWVMSAISGLGWEVGVCEFWSIFWHVCSKCWVTLGRVTSGVKIVASGFKPCIRAQILLHRLHGSD